MKKKKADLIRDYCIKTRIEPARLKNEKIVSIRAGDIHTEMKLKNNMPAVCGALQTQIFEQDANVKRFRITGPGNGANCVITFDIL